MLRNLPFTYFGKLWSTGTYKKKRKKIKKTLKKKYLKKR
jgi:hypothetical protein